MDSVWHWNRYIFGVVNKKIWTSEKFFLTWTLLSNKYFLNNNAIKKHVEGLNKKDS